MAGIIVDHISKSYKGANPVQALSDINMEVAEGELFGLIGPDGAGKTTLFRILTTLLLADRGSAYVGGYEVVKDYKEIRKIVGYMPGKFSLYQDLTVKENLTFFATIFDTTISENYELIKDIYIQLEPFEKRRAGALSGGMKQKLALCCALIHKPKVLFLDEPTTGVDAVSRKEFWAMLHQLKEQGITIFVSTPYMDEASLCDRIALIQEGNIFSINTPQKLIDGFENQLWAIKSHDMYKLLLNLETYSGIESCYSFGEYHHVVFSKQNINEEEVLTYLNSIGHQGVEAKKILPTIEDCFLGFMNKNIEV